MHIRKAEARDWPRIHELCCLTGKAGEPIEPERWEFFGQKWIGPYQRLLPDWTFVSEQDGEVMGYLTGCPDTRSFERAKFVGFHVPLLARVLLRRYEWNADVSRYIRRTLKLEREPVERFSKKTKRALELSFPAHLHINFDERCRGLGLGGALVTEFCKQLKANGIAGVHVVCGQGPLRFYQRHGFVELERILVGRSGTHPGTPVIALGRSF